MNTSRDKDEKNDNDDYTEYYDDDCDYYEDEEVINIIEEEDAGATGGPPPRRLNPLECYYCGHLSSNRIAVAKHMISGHWDEVRERQGAGRRDNSNYYNNIDLDSRNIKPEPGRVKGRKVFKAQKTTQVMNNVNVNVTPKRDELSSQQIKRMEQELVKFPNPSAYYKKKLATKLAKEFGINDSSILNWLNKNGKKDFGRVKTTPRTPPEASRSLKEGSRANVSFVWDHFTKIDQERRVCNHCGETLTVSRGSTWKLRTHIMKEHNDKLSEDYKTTPVPSSQSNMEIKKEIVEKTVQSAKKSSEIQCPAPRENLKLRREAEKEASARNEQQILPPEDIDDEYEDDDFDGELIDIYEGHEQQQQGEDMGEEEVNAEESESEDFFDGELIDIYEGHEQEQQGEEVGEEEVNDEEAETTPPASAPAPPDEETLDLIYGSLPPSPLRRRRTPPPSPRTPTLRPSDDASTSFWPPPTVWSRRRRLYEGETGEDSTSKKSKSDLLILC